MTPRTHDQDITSWLQLLSAIEEAETGHGTARLTEICLSAYGELAAAQFQITQLRARIHVLAARRTVMTGQNISRPGREKPTARRSPGRAAPGQGFTLYWFAPDTATTTSRCNGSCAQIWPPVNGPATAGPGIPGRLGTITRSDGATQATYDGSKSGLQLTPGLEQRLVDRIAVGGQLNDQGIQRNVVEHDGDENPALPLGQLPVHGPMQRG